MRNPASIECTLSKATLKAIPATTSERKRFLQGRIGAFVGKDFPCPALGGKVKVIKKSVGGNGFSRLQKPQEHHLCANVARNHQKRRIGGHNCSQGRTANQGVLFQENP
jgi:hypothetical protein